MRRKSLVTLSFVTGSKQLEVSGGENRWGVNGWSHCLLSQDPNNWKSLWAKTDWA